MTYTNIIYNIFQIEPVFSQDIHPLLVGLVDVEDLVGKVWPSPW